MDVVIYHNPDCGTSRNVLAIIEAAGYTANSHRVFEDWMDQGLASRPLCSGGVDAMHGAPRNQIASRGTGSSQGPLTRSEGKKVKA